MILGMELLTKMFQTTKKTINQNIKVKIFDPLHDIHSYISMCDLLKEIS